VLYRGEGASDGLGGDRGQGIVGGERGGGTEEEGEH
jgi:hypothetical protein